MGGAFNGTIWMWQTGPTVDDDLWYSGQPDSGQDGAIIWNFEFQDYYDTYAYGSVCEYGKYSAVPL